VRTDRYLYAEYGTGERELYDLRSDPFELTSRHNDPSLAAVRAKLDATLARLQNCAGKGCRAAPAVKLKLGYSTRNGVCVDSAVKTIVFGDTDGADQARFFANGRKAGRDGGTPFARTIGAGRLTSKRKNRIEAIVTVLDGRNVTLKQSIPPAC
jgi:hypothetical protein